MYKKWNHARFAQKHALLFCLIGAFSLNACVGIEDVKNWRPQRASLDGDYHKCLSKSPPTGLRYPYGVNAVPQCRSLVPCLRERGYHVRSESPLEIASDVILFPFYLLAFSGGACFKMGIGKSEWPY